MRPRRRRRPRRACRRLRRRRPRSRPRPRRPPDADSADGRPDQREFRRHVFAGRVDAPTCDQSATYAHTGTYAVKLDANPDYLYTPLLTCPGTLTYWMYATAGATSFQDRLSYNAVTGPTSRPPPPTTSPRGLRSCSTSPATPTSTSASRETPRRPITSTTSWSRAPAAGRRRRRNADAPPTATPTERRCRLLRRPRSPRRHRVRPRRASDAEGELPADSRDGARRILPRLHRRIFGTYSGPQGDQSYGW